MSWLTPTLIDKVLRVHYAVLIQFKHPHPKKNTCILRAGEKRPFIHKYRGGRKHLFKRLVGHCFVCLVLDSVWMRFDSRLDSDIWTKKCRVKPQSYIDKGDCHLDDDCHHDDDRIEHGFWLLHFAWRMMITAFMDDDDHIIDGWRWLSSRWSHHTWTGLDLTCPSNS